MGTITAAEISCHHRGGRRYLHQLIPSLPPLAFAAATTRFRRPCPRISRLWKAIKNRF
ncbi:hypothetical protein MIMGU_mgv1a017590mg [Erythranthe guttata]|uniref:Uncharacterized protein n=1 Tax=Erythranthe guttata TaxID=4155 RepID=A0A022R5C0_ERYGU|nr:hypothetical protein MIMGU_mgv1a017590mg [Erythranthe guttata]